MAPAVTNRNDATSKLSPIDVQDLGTRTVGIFSKRGDTSSTFVPGEGTVAPDSFNNAGMLALFALIGAAMVAASIWFFFFAKNGGFHFKENDWDDYKSTILRRKGPDGKTLSNATKSTRLGGGSIVTSRYLDMQKHMAKSSIGYDEKGRKGVMGKRGFAKSHSIWSGDDYMTETFGTQTVSDMTEVRSNAQTEYTGGGRSKYHSKRHHRDRDFQDYKREKPARVGGLNRVADGSGHASSHFDHSTVTGSDLASETHSEEPILAKQQRSQAKDRERAERRAKDEAARMERRWKKEAEEAAAALARENTVPPPPPTTHTRKSATPSSSKPHASKHHRREGSTRSSSPKKRESTGGNNGKRDFSYQPGPASEVLSTAYTATTSQTGTSRTASYYDAYRPKNTVSDAGNSKRQSSPRKGGASRGYRRGGRDSLADSDLD
ncbi:hypothetical protein K431DRAFT_323853 [Polychaeton citri CBS 116435]|uniref:Endosomal spry domain-containing protein n=1 Tax=Polychaeton citri CBS 116435 TaxID=1314669 RepID=A0A9P4UKL2_9PEZI|nr:hypothetical protein K431DRAFT_323853 [Polychaeton citri CBS 116435]